MERITSKLTVAFVALLLCAAATASSQTPRKVSRPTGATPRPICDVAREARARNSPAAPGLEAQCRAAGGDSSARTSGVETAIGSLGAGASATKTDALPRVPNVVGLLFTDAASALSQAGFEPTWTFEDEPDPSVTYGHVRATVPAAGTLAAGGKVELQIPRVARLVGIGALSVRDALRRDGFDLDEGRYEQIYRGADIMMIHHENQPAGVLPSGRTYYAGEGLYIEPSDGAVLALVSDTRDISRYGLGSFLYYSRCKDALRTAPGKPGTGILIDGITVYDASAHDLTICVLTSKQQIAVAEFRVSDNPYRGLSNIKFHFAVFPSQLGILNSEQVRPIDSKRTNRDNSHVLAPKKRE